MTRILVLSKNSVGDKMSAPGIRALNVARTLQAQVPGARVTLAIPNATGQPRGEPFAIEHYRGLTLPRLILESDVVVAQYIRATSIPFLAGKRVVLDFFANFIAEWLELWAEEPDDPLRDVNMDCNRRYLNLQLAQADLVLAANEQQRDLWLGTLASIGRVTPEVYDADPSLRSLIDVAPFGVRPDPPVPRKRVLKGVLPGIGPDDFVLLWNGGIVHWYDPTTLLQAMALVRRARPHVKLLFLGTKYPIDEGIEGQTLTDMFALSHSLGLTGSNVFFNEGWVDYEDSGDFLLEADAGVCTYYSSLETHFAYRVRLIDLIWAEKPIICNQIDTVAEMVRSRGLGLSLPFRDVDALATAIIRLADDAGLRERCRENERALKPELSWENCLAPLVRFCCELPAPSVSRSLALSATSAGSYAAARFDHAVRRVPTTDWFLRLAGKPPRRRAGQAASLTGA
jgi:glycosyltransferase involved in cell wall biosynthesis